MDFCKRFSSKPEFIALIKGNTGLNNANAAVREGTQHVLSSMRQNPEVFNPQTINRMDMVFEELPSQTLPCTACRFDLEINVPPASFKFYEFKSYKTESIIGISINQFKNYLSQVTDWNQFRYIFNRAKTPDLDVAKKEFAKVFANNAQELWDTNESLMRVFKMPNGIPVQNFIEFKALTKSDNFWSQLTFIDF